MAYRLLTTEECRAVITESGIRSDDIPAYGLLLVYSGKTILVFRKTDGVILCIDVSDAVPPNFSQPYPAPVGFWDEVGRRLGKLPGQLGTVAVDVGSGALMLAVAVLIVVLIWKK